MQSWYGEFSTSTLYREVRQVSKSGNLTKHYAMKAYGGIYA
jgi:hypothetical protein